MRDFNRLGATVASATLIGAALLVSSTAIAAPSLEITHAVAQVTIIPENRPDVTAMVLRSNAKFPLTVTRVGDRVIIEGGLGWRGANCNSIFGHRRIGVIGIGSVAYEDLPQVVVRTPRQVQVKAGGAVFGTIGRGDGVELANSGCGDWTVANQTGPLQASLAGSGDLHAGDAGTTDLHVAGSSDVFLRAAHGGLTATIAGSGAVNADEVDGPLRAHVTGSGDVKVRAGTVSDMQVAVAGSGDIRFGGVAQSLEANIAGSGDVSVAKVTGPVVKHIAGSGDVTVGQ